MSGGLELGRCQGFVDPVQGYRKCGVVVELFIDDILEHCFPLLEVFPSVISAGACDKLLDFAASLCCIDASEADKVAMQAAAADFFVQRCKCL
ncbi:MAG: hypothetical protein Q4A96_04825, partial [Candidatus Saccharibacteria bacterium]|nr:hypothetical protein [Candidatus Saccharibacteria bacterium]